MQKFVNYIEQYVQWVAIGIGGLYMLLMIWSYVLQPPVTVAINGRTETPDQVPGLTVGPGGPLRTLEEQMNSTAVPNIKVRTYTPDFDQVIAWTDTRPIELALPWIDSNAMTVGPTTQESTPGLPNRQWVQALPVPPEPTWKASSSGRSVVQAPDPKAAPGAAGAAAMTARDCQWVTESFVLSTKDLDKAFQAVNLPQNSQSTMFLRVTLQRQEMLANGSFGNDTEIGPLAIHVLPEMPAKDNPPVTAAINYDAWAAKNTADIIQPSFYVVDKPDYWYAPGQANPNAVTKTVLDIVPKSLTPPPQPRPRPRPRPSTPPPGVFPGGPPPGMGAPGRREIADPQRLLLADARTNGQPANTPPGMPPGIPPEVLKRMQQSGMPFGPGMMPPGMMPPGAMPPGMMPPTPTRQGASQPVAYSGPNGMFVPASIGDVEIWAHDDTVQPGKTYRYRLSYTLRNPVYKAGVTQPSKLGDVYALTSQFSKWSDPIAVPPNTYFFVASGIAPNGEGIRIDLFHWKNGEWQLKPITVVAGDAIEDTGWTLVDICNGSSEVFALLTDDSGNLVLRDYKKDRGDPRYQQLQEQTKETKIKTAAAPGVPVAVPGARTAQ